MSSNVKALVAVVLAGMVLAYGGYTAHDRGNE